MKLYTEEQVREAIEIAMAYSNYELTQEDILTKVAPIELPSDEEIDGNVERIFNIPEDKIGNVDYGANIAHSRRGFKHGAKWVIEHIKQQDK